MNIQYFTPRHMVIALVSAGVISVAGIGAYAGAHAAPTTPSEQLITTPLAAVALPDFSEITLRNGPAVVNVSVTGSMMASTGDRSESPGMRQPSGPRMNQEDPFFEFFRRFQGPQFGMPGQGEIPVHGQGSGFIISETGLILTNAHVVRDAKEVTVKLTDRREFVAKVLGVDPKTDVAVLKIDAKNLPIVTLGSARDLKVGAWVLAIGSPFGFDNSVTAGVVSAKGRSLPDDSYVPFIQTDVAVNPGNSGGPLFNTKGEVVGINSQIYSHTGGYQGLSFAIPIDLAKKVKDQIVSTGKASHARLGVTIQGINQGLADSFKLDKLDGALIVNVEQGSPAEQAGLRSGDVIRKLNGQPIVTSGDLPATVGQSTPGEKVTLEIWRQGKSEVITAKLGDAGAIPVEQATSNGSSIHGKLGLALRPLQPEERKESGIAVGLLIENAGGPSEQAGVQAGDVLLSVNGTPARSVEQVRDQVAHAKSVALLIQRGDNRIFVPVRIG